MNRKASDNELLERMRAYNDAGAFKELYERYWEKLYHLACRKIDSVADACDLLQDIFIKLWEKRAEISITTTLDGYLFVSLKNKIFNYYKHYYLERRHTLRAARTEQVTENAFVSKRSCEEINESIDRGIAGMPFKMRTVFLLSRQDHLPARLIAKRLSISEQTVRNQLSSAIHRLREVLEKKSK